MSTPRALYFDALPIHPPPKDLESFTGYLTRLAEGNDINSMTGLLRVLSIRYRQTQTLTFAVDHPPYSFGLLPTVVVKTESELLATTFYYLGKRFGRSTREQPLNRFLSGAIAHSLRYCPQCLTEKPSPYYRLTWRFSFVKGCATHGCHLLDRCWACEGAIPLFAAPFRIGICPHCHCELKKSKAELLEPHESRENTHRTEDLIFLLSPHQYSLSNKEITKIVGQQLGLLRQRSNKTQAEVAQQMGEPIRAIERFDQGGPGRGGPLVRYLNYVDTLQTTFQVVFDTPLLKQYEIPGQQGSRRSIFQNLRSSLSDGDGHFTEQLLHFLHEQQQQGQRVTLEGICRHLRIPLSYLQQSAQIRAILVGIPHERSHKVLNRRQVREQELMGLIQAAIAELKQNNRPVTQQAISRRLGFHLSSLVKYQLVRELLTSVAQDYPLTRTKRTQYREAELVELLKRTIEQFKTQGKPITQRAVCAWLHMSISSLNHYPEVKKVLRLLAKASPSIVERRRFHKEELLIKRVEEARAVLEQRRQPVTLAVVCQLARIYVQDLRPYPNVRERLNRIVAARPQAIALRAQRREQDLLEKMQAIIARRRRNGEPLTQKAICEELGMYPESLKKRYPQIKALLDDLIQERSRRAPRRISWQEEDLLVLVRGAIAELEAANMPVTQRAICRKLQMEAQSLRRYPRIEALLKEVVKARGLAHQALRRQREERLLSLTQQAIDQLNAKHEPITKKAICDILRVQWGTLHSYPRIKELLARVSYNKSQLKVYKTRQREQELVEKIQLARKELEAQGLPITQMALARSLQMNTTSLRCYPEVRAIFDQLVQERQNLDFTRRATLREQELLNKAKDIVEQLRRQELPITQGAICRRLHMGLQNIKQRYAQVKLFLEQAAATSPVPHKRIDPSKEQELLAKVYAAIKQLRAARQAVTQGRICKLLQIYPGTLKQYPRVGRLLTRVIQAYPQELAKRAQLRQAALVKAAHYLIKQSEQKGQHLSPKEICSLLNISLSKAYYYPQVRLLLQQQKHTKR